VFVVFIYVQFQARNFLQGPSISLDEIGGTLQKEQAIPITGKAQNIVKLTLNGREIHTNGNGDFAQTLILEDGYTIMTLEAQDRFGRKTFLTREFVYLPQSTDDSGNAV
jgi:hypothetical protein